MIQTMFTLLLVWDFDYLSFKEKLILRPMNKGVEDVTTRKQVFRNFAQSIALFACPFYCFDWKLQ